MPPSDLLLQTISEYAVAGNYKVESCCLAVIGSATTMYHSDEAALSCTHPDWRREEAGRHAALSGDVEKDQAAPLTAAGAERCTAPSTPETSLSLRTPEHAARAAPASPTATSNGTDTCAGAGHWPGDALQPRGSHTRLRGTQKPLLRVILAQNLE